MKTLQSSDIQNHINGTSLKGYLDGLTYQDLVEILGEPTHDTPSFDEKVNVEWVVMYKNEVFTIYDWKSPSRHYTIYDCTRWNVGGKTYAGDFIQELQTITRL